MSKQNQTEPKERLTSSFVSIFDKFVDRLLCFTRKESESETNGYSVFSGEVFEREPKRRPDEDK